MKETEAVEPTRLGPNWIKEVRVSEKAGIQAEPQDDAHATHQGEEREAEPGWGRGAPNRAARKQLETVRSVGRRGCGFVWGTHLQRDRNWSWEGRVHPGGCSVL